jgi:Glycosyl transferase family 11
VSIRWSHRYTWKEPSDLEFLAMTACDHHILSNGTFSWWAAWRDRNPREIVVVPGNGFVPGMRQTIGFATIEKVKPQASVTRDGRLRVVNPRFDWRYCRQSEADSISLELANQSDE